MEAVLDTSWAGATAPNATIKLVVSASTNTSDGVILSAEYIIDNSLTNVMSASFGSCEAHFTQSQAAVIAAMAEQAATQGITYLVASGDTGAAGCDSSAETVATGPAWVNMLASSPYTLAVGGTQFDDFSVSSGWISQNYPRQASVTSSLPEQVWSEGLASTGGGVSRFFAKPAWQTAVPGIPDGRSSRCSPTFPQQLQAIIHICSVREDRANRVGGRASTG
jgi:subtilase family serine protease